MSHSVECQTEFRDPNALVAALIEIGFEPSQIKAHSEAVPLFGYRGDVRTQQAHIVIRRRHVGVGANDVGWERQADGAYRAWISDAGCGLLAGRDRLHSACARPAGFSCCGLLPGRDRLHSSRCSNPRR